MSKLFVPNEILRVFKDYYPDVELSSVEWSWEVPGKIYEADFSNAEADYEVEITVTGHLLLTEISLDLEEVPSLVMEHIGEDFPDHSINEASFVQYSTGDITYELALTNAQSGDAFEVHYREDGLFLTKGYDL